jgi:hypothetical protein
VGKLVAKDALALVSWQIFRTDLRTSALLPSHINTTAAVMALNDSAKRAASRLTIAQHKFKQALKKEDIENRLPPVDIELSAQFLSDVAAVVEQSTPANVQVSDYKAIDHFSPGAGLMSHCRNAPHGS